MKGSGDQNIKIFSSRTHLTFKVYHLISSTIQIAGHWFFIRGIPPHHCIKCTSIYAYRFIHLKLFELNPPRIDIQIPETGR